MSLLADGRLVTPDGVIDGWLETTGRTITATGSGMPPRPADRNLAGSWVLPGFVDIHVHGGAGADFMAGDQTSVRQIVDLHRRHGTTTTLASLVTAELNTLVTTLGSLADLVDDELLAGIHLEGPFLAPTRSGAHDRGLLRPPEPDVVDRLISAGRGGLRMVTLAPEQPNAVDAIRRFVRAGVAVALGHTDATYDQTRAAIDAGAIVGTHLFNAMRPLHHRDPGPVPALLEDDRVTVELICDGIHLHAATIRLAMRSAGAYRIALITDAMAAAGAGDGDYPLGATIVQVRDGVARLAENETIAGSTLTMDRAFRFAIDAGIGLDDAVRMTSTTPARVLGMADRVGSVAVGLDADLLVLDETFHLRDVMTKGKWMQVGG
jgi:N-acetylglucosamine-6-phosphate deacetylase